MGEEIKLTDTQQKIVRAVRARQFMRPEDLQNFLGGNDPVKATEDLLRAAEFLVGDNRKVITNVLEATDQVGRISELFNFATTPSGISSIAEDVLKDHACGEKITELLIENLLATTAPEVARALAIASSRPDTKEALTDFVTSETENENYRAIVALRFRSFLKPDTLTGHLNALSTKELLRAFLCLGNTEEGNLLRKHLRQETPPQDLFDEAVDGDSEAFEALETHTNKEGAIESIVRGLHYQSSNQVACDLLENRKSDAITDEHAIPDLFAAFSNGTRGVVFETLVAHKKTDVLYRLVREELLSPEDAPQNRRDAALKLINSRKDLAAKLSAELGVTVTPNLETETTETATDGEE